jgi:hypothetical protein
VKRLADLALECVKSRGQVRDLGGEVVLSGCLKAREPGNLFIVTLALDGGLRIF